ncbi:hypothetical protein [Mycobacterium shigaense]|uniref:Uncharacterized protein n=1 Tax=Mycobacterium shigaense TaxID=722731 RepID=A0A1Z4EN95_9MYCO|nr:hypothetical protein [Mycobacterium shigaense]BAX94469.1 hypothetical protein MSG_04352 [Mycobacterium shigaense]
MAAAKAGLLTVGVIVRFLEAGFVHVLMDVLGSVLVGVGVLVREVVVIVPSVSVSVRDLAMLVFVRVWPSVSVWLCHDQLQSEYIVSVVISRVTRPARPPGRG